MEMKPAYCAASSQVPFNEERLTRPNRRGGWRVTTQAARTGLWMDRQNLRGRQKDFLRTPLSSWNSCCNWGKGSVAAPLLCFWLAVWRWTSAWTETSPLFRNVSARWKSARAERGNPVSSPREKLIEVQTWGQILVKMPVSNGRCRSPSRPR